MRTNPPFDPRMQPMGVYVGSPPQRYLQPVIPQNMIIKQGFTPMPPINQQQQVPIYQMHPHPNQAQLQPQQINQQARGPRVQQNPAAGIGEVTKPASVPANSKMINDTQQMYKPQSGEEYDQQEGEEQQQYEGQYGDEEEQDMKNQQIIMFWQHKFYTILQRFQLIFEKVQMIRSDFYNLNTELKNVDSEDQWNQAKQHHDDFMEQLEQFSQELAGVIKENASLVQQNQNQDNQHNIWKDRYFQLFQGYKAMQGQFIQLKDAKGDDNKVNQLMANYTELSRQYSQVASQLAQLKQKGKGGLEGSSEKVYRQKLDFAIREAEKYKDTLDQLHKQNEEMAVIIDELKMEKHNLEMMVESNNQNNHQQNYEQFNRAINERDQQINLLNKQLKQLSEKYNFLVQTHNSMSNRIQQQQPRIKSKFSELEQQISSKNMEIMELRSRLLQAELKQKSTSSVSQQYQKILKIRTAEVQDRDLELQRLKREYAQVSNSRKNESDKDLAIIKKQYEGRVKKLQDEYEQKLDALKKKLRKKQQQVQSTTLLAIKLQSLEKKNKMLLQQIESLSNDLHSKQKQSIELKRVSSIQQKFKQLEYQYHSAVDQKEQVTATLNQRNLELESLQTQINQFESRIKSLSQSTQNSNSKPLLNEIEELNKLIQLKENDINKLKANVSLKQGTIKQLQNEVQRAKGAVIANEKLYSRQKQAYGQNIRTLQRKNQQNEKKMRELEFEYGSIMKKNLQDQIKNLRSQNQQKQENIIRLEAEDLELRSRLSHYERIRSSHNSDLDQLTNRIKDLETSKYEMIKKVENSFRDVKNKERENRELADSLKTVKENITKLEFRISENDKVIQQKDKIIENIEGQLMVANSRLAYISEENGSLRLRKRDQTDLLVKQSDDLRKKVFEYQHLNGSKKQFKEKFSSQITKIQNQMIQQLKQQKQFLKGQLAVALQQIGNLPTNDKLKSSKKPKASQGIDYIQKRLFDFNNRLDEIIMKNKQINRGFGSNIQNSKVSAPRGEKDSQEQIKNLKNQIQELRKYISKLEVEAAGETIKYNPKNELIYQEQEKIYSQRVEFYQNQTNELEARIQSLIKVNKSLKERIDSLLKDSSNSSVIDFYKSQLVISEETIQNLHNKMSKLMEQNRSLKSSNNENSSRICREYEDKIFECENKIFLLERKVSALELQRNKSQNAKVDIQRNLNLVQTELQALKYSSEKQIDAYKKNSKELGEQVLKFENESTELLEKIRMLQSENSRLSQAVHASYSQQHILLNTPVKDSTPKPSQFKK